MQLAPTFGSYRRRVALHALLSLLLLLLLLSGAAHAQVAHPDLAAVSRLVASQTNGFRAAQGLAKTEPDATLTATAQYFANYMASTDRYGHEADGHTPAERAQARGYDYCVVAENIAFMMNSEGFTTDGLAQDFVEGWKNSPEHRRNMLDSDVVDSGVAVAHSARSQRYYAVQMFGRPRSKMLRFSIGNPTAREVRYQLGGQSFSLAPRVTRTHGLCRATGLSIGSGPDAQTMAPANGRHYTFELQAGGGLRLKADQ